MSAINEDTRAAWQAIADELSKQRPHAGRRVRVVGGRKHKGKEGLVERHQLSKYGDAYRYASEAQAHMRDMAGRDGWVCLVRTDAGETFWINAQHTEVV